MKQPSMSMLNGQRAALRTQGQATRSNKPLLHNGYAAQNRRSMGEYRIPREIQTGLGRTQATTGYGQGNFASSASSLPRMHAADSGSNFGATTNVGPTSTIRNQIMAEMNTAPPEE